jgi:hypothetical protein
MGDNITDTVIHGNPAGSERPGVAA